MVNFIKICQWWQYLLTVFIHSLQIVLEVEVFSSRIEVVMQKGKRHESPGSNYFLLFIVL